MKHGIALTGIILLACCRPLVAQTPPSIQTILSNAQALAASQPIADKSVPVFSWDNRGAPGTYWRLQRKNYPPMPGNPFPELPVYEIDPANHVYLIDDRSVDYPALEARQAEEQAAAAMTRRFSLALDSEGEIGEPGASSLMMEDYGTNLWLEIPAVTNGWASVILHNVQQGEAYELMSKQSLNEPAWKPEQTLHTVIGRDWIAATVPVLDRTASLFLWARDWTGLDDNANSMPDWWEFENFGDFNQAADGDYDGDGASNANEYNNGNDPNTVTFYLTQTNQYVNSSSDWVQLHVVSGVPASVAVLVDNTNLAEASWTAYTSTNIAVNLGPNEGWHKVRVGLRGGLPTSQQVWQMTRFKLDVTPPQIAITSPAGTTISRPLIQLEGCSPEVLSRTSYDLTNAAGSVTNQQVLRLGKFCDTNIWEFTTNYFQAFDVGLMEGVNLITLHATDQAGNTTITNFTFILDYSNDSNAPAISLRWPQDRTRVCGNDVAWRGALDDPTAIVTATVIGTNGVTNAVAVIVERDGAFWAEHLPLEQGTNRLSLVAVDAAGNVSATNITVINEPGALMIDPVSADELTGGLFSKVTGTIGLSDCTVWVNGVRATQTNGTWQAEKVRFTAGGTVVIQAAAIPNSDNGGNGSGVAGLAQNPASADSLTTELEQDRPSFIYMASFQGNYSASMTFPWGAMLNSATTSFRSPVESDNCGNGSSDTSDYTEGAFWEAWHYEYDWPPNVDPVTVHVTYDYSGLDGNRHEEYSGEERRDSAIGAVRPVVSPYDPYLISMGPITWHDEDGGNIAILSPEFSRSIGSELKLWTGGKSVAGHNSLFRLGARAVTWIDYVVPDAIEPIEYYFMWNSYDVPAVPPIGDVAADGSSYVVLPDGKGVDVMPEASGTKVQLDASKDAYKAQIKANGTVLDAENPTLEFCVGQKVTFSLDWVGNAPSGLTSSSYEWILSSKCVNHTWQYSAGTPPLDLGSINYDLDPDLLRVATPYAWWFSDGKKTVTLNLTLNFDNGKSVTMKMKGKFTVHRPNAAMLPLTPAQSTRYYTLRDGGPFSMLKLGTNDGSGNGEMFFKTSVFSKFAGNADFTQLITADYSNPFGSFSDERCDGTEFYSNPPARVLANLPGSTVVLFDGPYEWWTTPNKVSLSARDFLRFKPDGDGSIWVTLGIVNWETVGIAEQSFGGTWTITEDATSSPSGPDTSDEFPVWIWNLASH